MGLTPTTELKVFTAFHTDTISHLQSAYLLTRSDHVGFFRICPVAFKIFPASYLGPAEQAQGQAWEANTEELLIIRQ